MAIFYLKENDTKPVLEVVLSDPDGTAHDLTGVDSVNLHISLSDGTKIQRAMTVTDAEAGTVQYAWQSTDWDTGNLVAGPVPPLDPADTEHTMEYEVVNGSDRQTFPNDGYDTLRIYSHIADA